MLRAIQAFYHNAKIVVKVRGHVGNSTITTSGVRQGCPFCPTLFGVYIDALEGYLHDRVPLAGITLNTPDGGTRLLASLIYADDIVLMDGDPDSLQRTLDSFAAFCTAYGLEISLNKIKIMQFLPTRRRGQPPPVRHAFALGSYDLETVDVYKYLGVSFCCSGNPADYMPVALRNLEYSARRLKQQYGGMACGNNIQLQLGFFDAYVTSSAMFGGELWGVHPRAAGKRKKTAARYASLLKKFAGVGSKTPTEPFLLELGWLSLEDRWQQSALRFWNQLVALPENDLYRDVLFDSVTTRSGFARGLQRICSSVGYDLVLHPDPPRLHRLDCAAIMQLKRQLHLVAMEDAADVDPRTCPSAGAVACTYWRWFRRSDMQQREQRRHHTSILSFRQQSQPAATVSAWLPDLLPVVSGRYRQVPRHQRLCRHCLADCVGDEKHLIFECSALDHIRHKFSVLFIDHHSVRSFMNQVSQRDVLHFVCDCLDYYSLLADVGVADAQ